MPESSIVVQADGRTLAGRVRWARTRRERRRGLLDLPPLLPGDALVIPGASQVHTFGMKQPIDVLFCSRGWRVRRISRGLRPNRVSRVVPFAAFVVELPEGAADGVERRSRLIVEPAIGPGDPAPGSRA